LETFDIYGATKAQRETLVLLAWSSQGPWYRSIPCPQASREAIYIYGLGHHELLPNEVTPNVKIPNWEVV
jgi:hypothetical protein